MTMFLIEKGIAVRKPRDYFCSCWKPFPPGLILLVCHQVSVSWAFCQFLDGWSTCLASGCSLHSALWKESPRVTHTENCYLILSSSIVWLKVEFRWEREMQGAELRWLIDNLNYKMIHENIKGLKKEVRWGVCPLLDFFCFSVFVSHRLSWSEFRAVDTMTWYLREQTPVGFHRTEDRNSYYFYWRKTIVLKKHFTEWLSWDCWSPYGSWTLPVLHRLKSSQTLHQFS